MLRFRLPLDMESRSVVEQLRIYAKQISPEGGGARLAALLEEAAVEIELTAYAPDANARRRPY